MEYASHVMPTVSSAPVAPVLPVRQDFISTQQAAVCKLDTFLTNQGWLLDAIRTV